MSSTSKPHEAAKNALKPDPSEIERALSLILQPGQVTELRVLDAVTARDRRPHTVSGYFDDPAELAAAAADIVSAKGIYFVPNPVNPALLARSMNKARAAGKEPTTGDADILRRHWLLVDCDAVRPAGIAASDEEHEAALARAIDIDAWLQEQGWPAGIYADSGNGGHLLYRIDLPADDGGLVRKCLAALAKRFDDERVRVDAGVLNPARIWKLYGTPAGKGDGDAAAIGRPHRLARILNAPERLDVVPVEQLEALAGEAPQPASGNASIGAASPRTNGTGFDLPGWICRCKLDVTGPQPWQGSGQRYVFRQCPWNPEHTNGSAYIAQLPSGAIIAGCHHNSCQGRDWPALRDLCEPDWRDRRAATGSDRLRGRNWDAEPPIKTPVLVNLASVTPRPVQWLWPGRIALGKLTIVAGEPGLGKSFLTLDLAARVTTGNPWPDKPRGFNQAGSVVLLSAEDDVEDTIRPRLDAAGAAVEHITAMQGVEFRADSTATGTRRTFSLETDLPALEQAIEASPDCRLVIIDPISAYLGSKDSHKNAEIRGLLSALADLAAKWRVAVVAVTHLNKGVGGKAMHRVTGSLGFIAAARAGWLVAPDKNNPKRRLFLPIKNNLAEDVGGLAYAIIEGAVAWERDPVNLSADDALAEDPSKQGGRQRDEAVAWLAEQLAAGPMPADDIYEAAEANGFSRATLRRAQKGLGIKPQKQGFQDGSRWIWKLPARRDALSHEDARARAVSTFDTFEPVEHLEGESGDISAPASDGEPRLWAADSNALL